MYSPKHVAVDARSGIILAAGPKYEMSKIRKKAPPWSVFVGYSDKAVGEFYLISKFHLEKLNASEGVAK